MNLTKEEFLEALTLVGQNADSFADYFYDRVRTNIEEFDIIFRNSDLRLQKSEFIKGILKLYSIFESKNELESYLIHLGTRHVCYEVRDRHYPQIKQSFIESLSHLHHDAWTQQKSENWSEFVNYITTKMMIGSRSIKEVS